MPKTTTMPNQDDTTTAPQTPITLAQLRDAIFDRLNLHEAKQDARLDEMESRNVARHVTIMQTLQQHESRLNDHDTDLKEMRDGRFPQMPLWAIAGIAFLMWLTVVAFMVLYASSAFAR